VAFVAKISHYRKIASPFFISNVAADDRHQGLGVKDIRLRNRHDVFGENGQVGKLTVLKGSFEVLFERCVCRAKS